MIQLDLDKIPTKKQLRKLADINLNYNEILDDINLNLQWGNSSYDENSKKSKLKTKSGCYEWFGLSDGKSYYVGRSKNIRNRIIQHLKFEGDNGWNKTPAEITFELSEWQMGLRVWYIENVKIYEGAFIKILKPKLNSKTSGYSCLICKTGMLMPLQSNKIIICVNCKRKWIMYGVDNSGN